MTTPPRRRIALRLRGLGGIGLLVWALGCGGGDPLPPLAAPDPVVERSGDELTIRWDGAPDGSEVPVYAGRSPDAIDRARPIAELRAGRATVAAADVSERPYFWVGDYGVVAERILPLEGAHNFRDLGGYRTADGRRVKWGQLFRSDALADLTDDDLEYLADLDISLVCDFRSDAEVKDGPDRIPEQRPPDVLHLPISDTGIDPAELRRRITTGDIEGVDFGQLLVDGNREFATTFSDRYATMFDRALVADNRPMLVHCTAGKDRAGFASAIMLTALGVPEDVVFEDYLLTNRYTREHTERLMLLIRVGSLFRTDPEDVRPLMMARREYLQTAFDTIREQHGDVDTYLRDALGLSDEERTRLQTDLLTP